VQLIRAGVLAGLAIVALVGAATLLSARTELPSFLFALACAAVLALRSRRAMTWPERAALALPALGLTLTSCVLAQSGATSLRLAGVGVLFVVAALAVLAGLVVGRRRSLSTLAAYLEYVAAAALVPMALWPLDMYDRLGLW
jgi:hypothetical protein